MAEPDGSRGNLPFEGFDKMFGFHLYRGFVDPEGRSDDYSLTPPWKAPIERLDALTDEGNMKRSFYRRLSPVPQIRRRRGGKRPWTAGTGTATMPQGGRRG